MAVAQRVMRQIAPIRLRAEVVHGFGRGSKQLGFPTANMQIRWDAKDESALTEEERSVLNFAAGNDTGVYCAFGVVEGIQDGGVHKVAMSLGWNPTFTDVKAKTIEPWILHNFSEEFYGRHLRLLVLGYVRDELKFTSVEQLIEEIKADGEFCSAALDGPDFAHYRSDAFLTSAVAPQPNLVQSPFPTHICSSSDVRSALLGAPPLRPGSARLLLVRHGETVENANGVLCGKTDAKLTERGRGQANVLSEQLCDLQREGIIASVDLVGSSSLTRAKDTADAIASRLPSASRAAFDDLGEMSYGELEGSRIADVRPKLAELAKRWREGDTRAAVGGSTGECPEDVASRILSRLRLLFANRSGQTVVLVCHANVNKILISSLVPALGLARNMEVPQRNCAVNLLDVDFGHRDSGVGDSNRSPEIRFEVLGVDLVADEKKSSLGRL